MGSPTKVRWKTGTSFTTLDKALAKHFCSKRQFFKSIRLRFLWRRKVRSFWQIKSYVMIASNLCLRGKINARLKTLIFETRLLTMLFALVMIYKKKMQHSFLYSIGEHTPEYLSLSHWKLLLYTRGLALQSNVWKITILRWQSKTGIEQMPYIVVERLLYFPKTCVYEFFQREYSLFWDGASPHELWFINIPRFHSASVNAEEASRLDRLAFC